MSDLRDEEIIAHQENLQRIRIAELTVKVQYAMDVTPIKIPCPICGAHMIMHVTDLEEDADGYIRVRTETNCVKGCSEGEGLLLLPDELSIEEFQEGKHRTGKGQVQNEIPECKWGSD